VDYFKTKFNFVKMRKPTRYHTLWLLRAKRGSLLVCFSGTMLVIN